MSFIAKVSNELKIDQKGGAIHFKKLFKVETIRQLCSV